MNLLQTSLIDKRQGVGLPNRPLVSTPDVTPARDRETRDHRSTCGCIQQYEPSSDSATMSTQSEPVSEAASRDSRER